MEKTYTPDQIRRMRAAYATITELESLKLAVPNGPHRNERVRAINERIEQWYNTVAYDDDELEKLAELRQALLDAPIG